MIDLVSTTFPPPKTPSTNTPLSLLPIFVTCDPARDTPSVLKSYLQEFHPSMIGLTGTWEQIKAVCKLYRVYFSTPEGVKPGMDYLVDHSIYFYLMGESSTFSWEDGLSAALDTTGEGDSRAGIELSTDTIIQTQKAILLKRSEGSTRPSKRRELSRII